MWREHDRQNIRDMAIHNLILSHNQNTEIRNPHISHDFARSLAHTHEETTTRTPTGRTHTQRQYTTMCKLADTDAQHAPRSGGDVAAVPGESESSKSHRPIRPNHQPPSAELESAYTRKAPQGSSFLPPGPGSHRVRFRGPCGQEVLGYGVEGGVVGPQQACLHVAESFLFFLLQSFAHFGWFTPPKCGF